MSAPSSLRRLVVALCGCSLFVSGLPARTITTPLADGFDFPVGKPDAVNYYKARGFVPGGHRGEDWNGKGGGDTDLGDPVYSSADGVVVLSQDLRQGWGNVIIIRHAWREADGTIKMCDSLYGHLHVRSLRKDQVVKRGDLVGTIGTAHGRYPAHLHFEIHKNLEMGMNRRNYPADYSVYWKPTDFINQRRKLNGGGRRYPIIVDTFGEYQPSVTTADRRGIPTREVSIDEKKRQLDRLIEQNRRASNQLSTEDEDSFWARLKSRLKGEKK